MIFFAPKNKKVNFLFIFFPKTKNFQNIQRNGVRIVKLWLDIWNAKFQIDIYFWQTYSPKTVSIDDAIVYSNCDIEHI